MSMGKGSEQHESTAVKKETSKPTSKLIIGDEPQLEVKTAATVPENYFPELCPLGINGLHSPQGDCKQFHDCHDGLLHSSHVCEAGLMFDNGQGRCISQRLVDSKCTMVTLETSHDQQQATDVHAGSATVSPPSYASKNEAAHTNNMQNQSLEASAAGTHNTLEAETAPEEDQTAVVPPDTYSPDMCPPDFSGHHANKDCTQYYECSDGYVGFVHTCSANHLFDKVRNRCISGELVSRYCYGPALTTEEEPPPALDDGGEYAVLSPEPPLSLAPAPAPSAARPVSSGKEGVARPEQAVFAGPDTQAPTDHNGNSDRARYTNWIMGDANGGRAPAAHIYYCVWMLTVMLPTI
jgi:hypothetical protein